MATTTQQQQQQQSSCPYAAALRGDDGDRDGDGNNKKEASCISNCPAFESGTCPFRDVKTAQEARETLLKVPPSHMDMSSFYNVVQNLHGVVGTMQQQQQAKQQTAGNNNDEQGSSNIIDSSSYYSFPGGCPVKGVLEKEFSFASAMEDLSLSAVMAKLAKEMDNDNNDESISSSNDEEDVTESPREELKKSAADATASGTSSTPIPSLKKGTSLPSSPATTDTTTTTTTRSSLSHSLKTGTAVSHQDAEDVHFVKNFVAGIIPRNLYAEMVGMLYHVYVALENKLSQCGPHYFQTCHFPNELNREEALAEDLEFWHGTKVPPMSSATKDYVDRIHYIAKHQPLLLLAHAYTRYLGDLSGGRILARVAKRAMKLDDDGLAFYEFVNIPSPKKFKDMYRQKLDELKLSQSEIQAIVGEANVAFCLNMRLFEELDVMGNVDGAVVRPLQDALKYAISEGGGESTNIPHQPDPNAKCPFIAAKGSSSSAAAAATTTATAQVSTKHKEGGGTCPWPFILLHDPVSGMKNWKTWALVGLLLSWFWSQAVVRMQTNE